MRRFLTFWMVRARANDNSVRLPVHSDLRLGSDSPLSRSHADEPRPLAANDVISGSGCVHQRRR